MKFFPIKIAIICMLVTPVLYIVTLTSYGKYLDRRYANQIQNILIGDSKALLDGSLSIEEQIAKNIQAFLKTDRLIHRFRLDINIFVSTENGKILYPVFFDINAMSTQLDNPFDAHHIAKYNYSILNAGLVVKTQFNLTHGSFISLVVLSLYSALSFFIFLFFHKKAGLKIEKEREEKAKLIKSLENNTQSQQQDLEKLLNERQGLYEDIEFLNTKYQQTNVEAKKNEEGLFEEIILLEEKLNSFIEQKQNKEIEINELNSKIEQYERRKGTKTKRIDFDFITKRFVALYKNISMDRKAITGFLNLNDDLQIKAEEIIFLLDRDPDKVIIKRKVFSGKKHKTACFEVLFSYNGRIYFKRNDNNIIQILIIGTKNTQTKDMEYLHSL